METLEEDLDAVLTQSRSIWNPLKKRTLTLRELQRAKDELQRASAPPTRTDFYHPPADVADGLLRTTRGEHDFLDGAEEEKGDGFLSGGDSTTKSRDVAAAGGAPGASQNSQTGPKPPGLNLNGGQPGPLGGNDYHFSSTSNTPSATPPASGNKTQSKESNGPTSQTQQPESIGEMMERRQKDKQKKRSLLDYMKEFEKFLTLESAKNQNKGHFLNDKRLLKKLMDFLDKGNFDIMADLGQTNEPYAEPWKLLTVYQLATRHLQKIKHGRWFEDKNLAEYLNFSVEERTLLRRLYLQLCQAHKDARIVAQLLQGRRKTGKLLKSPGSDSDSSSASPSPRPSSPEEGDVDSLASDELLTMDPEDFAPPDVPRVARGSPLQLNKETGRLEMPEGMKSPSGHTDQVHFDPNNPEVFNFLPGQSSAANFGVQFSVTEPVEKTRRKLYQVLTPRTRRNVRAEEKKGRIDATALSLYAKCAVQCFRLSQQAGKCVSTLQNTHFLDMNDVAYTAADPAALLVALENEQLTEEEAERLHYEAQMFDLITRSSAKNAVRRLPRCQPRPDFNEPQLPIEVLVNLCYKFGLVTERFEARRCVTEYLENHNKFLEVYPRASGLAKEDRSYAQFTERVSTVLQARKALQFEDFLNVLSWKSKHNLDFGNDLRALLKDQYMRRHGIIEVAGAKVGDRYSVYRDVFDSLPNMMNTVESMKTELLIDTIMRDLEVKQKRRVQAAGAKGGAQAVVTKPDAIPGVVAFGKTKPPARTGTPTNSNKPGMKQGSAPGGTKPGSEKKGILKKDKDEKKKKKRALGAPAASQVPAGRKEEKKAEEPKRPPSTGEETKVSIGILSKVKKWAHKQSTMSSWDDVEEDEVDEDELDLVKESQKNAKFRLGLQIRTNLDEDAAGNDARKLSLRQRWRMEIRDMDIVAMKRDKSDGLESFDDIKRHVQQGRFFVG
ncbi:unnamed protein product [Amoebophrya sp. A120]|nr:unnamed protein product [Amoebophrya sp. A120]|eukprot:GSA120T00018532001.1